MNTFVFLGIALVVAIADWVAVDAGKKTAEYILKPLVMVPLVVAAIVVTTPDPAAARPLIIAGLVFSLLGDVLLMLEDRFVPGAMAFLVAHLFYIAAFITMGTVPGLLLIALLIVVVAFRQLGVKIVVAAVQENRSLGIPVALYITAISVMVMFAVGTGRPWAIAGALLFYISDALIGYTKFVAEIPRQRVLIMSTYHLSQVAIVLSMLGVA